MVQAVDNDYWNDGTGFFSPNVRPGDMIATNMNMTPPVQTAGTPTTAVPYAPPAFDPRDADAMSGMSDDMMDDWNDWMYPQYREAINRDWADAASVNYHADAGANRMTVLGEQMNQGAHRLNEINENMYIPQAQRIIGDANQFSRDAFAERGVKTALGDMGAAFQNDREAARMRNAQYGIDPTSGRAMAQDRIAQVMHGANVAGAATRARAAAEEIWGKKQMDALNTSGVLNQNAGTIGQLRAGAGSMFTGSAGIRKLGLDATNQAFTHLSDVVGKSAGIYGAAGGLRNDAGALRLGGYKAERDSADTRYGIDRNFESNKYNTDKSLEGQKYSADKNAQASANAANAQKSSNKSTAIGSVIGGALAFF